MVHDLLGQKAVVDHVALTHEGEAAVLQYDIFLFWLQAAPQEFTYLPDGTAGFLDPERESTQRNGHIVTTLK